MSQIAALFLSAADCAQGRDPRQDYHHLKKFDGYWMAQTIKNRQPVVWDNLQGDGVERLYGFYVSSFTTMGTTSKSYLPLAEAENHPEWFLLDANGNRLRWSDDSANQFYGRYFLDVGNPEFQQWAAGEWLRILQEAGQKYLVFDNVMFEVWADWKTRTYPGWTYAGRSKEWRENFCKYLGVVKEKLNADGRELIINHTLDYATNLLDSEWKKLRNVCDGLAKECVLGTPNKIIGGSLYEYTLRNHDRNAGKWDWWLYRPNENATVSRMQFLYTYASFLLCKTEKSLFTDSTNFWHPEYDLDLGQPLRTRHSVNRVWVREYEKGIVAVNPTMDKRAVTIEQGYYLDDVTGNVYREHVKLLMQPMSGLIGVY